MTQALQGGGGDGIDGIVSAVAANNGVPDWIALDIMQEESGGNPLQVGDNGTSFGLFQLHYGGQADGYTQAQMFDPGENAKIAMPYIAQGYQWALSHGDTGFQMLVDTADHSGHPDSTGNMPGYYLTGLEGVYGGAGVLPSSGVGSYAPFYPVSSSISGGVSGFLQGLDHSMQFQGFDILHPFSFVTQNGEALGLRAFLFIVGILLVAFALLATVKTAAKEVV